jgi:clathrin heavy chain
MTDLMSVLIPRIDHARVVRTFRQIDHIPLIRSYLIAVQNVSISKPWTLILSQFDDPCS